MVIKNFDNFIIEEVNKPKLSEFDLRVLSYGLAECCIKAFESPEMQKKFEEWKARQCEKPTQRVPIIYSNIPVIPLERGRTLCQE